MIAQVTCVLLYKELLCYIVNLGLIIQKEIVKTVFLFFVFIFCFLL